MNAVRNATREIGSSVKILAYQPAPERPVEERSPSYRECGNSGYVALCRIDDDAV